MGQLINQADNYNANFGAFFIYSSFEKNGSLTVEHLF